MSGSTDEHRRVKGRAGLSTRSRDSGFNCCRPRRGGERNKKATYPRSDDTRVVPRVRYLSPSRIGLACIVYPGMDDKTGSPLTVRGKLAGCLMSLLVTIPLYVAERRARIEIKVRSHSASWPVPSPATRWAASSILPRSRRSRFNEEDAHDSASLEKTLGNIVGTFILIRDSSRSFLSFGARLAISGKTAL